MLCPALAISFILVFTSVLLFLVISQINEATAKRCTDEGISNGTTSSCRSQGSNTFTLSIPGTDGKTKEMNDGGDTPSAHIKSKHSNRGSSNTGDSEKNTPFELPFP